MEIYSFDGNSNELDYDVDISIAEQGEVTLSHKDIRRIGLVVDKAMVRFIETLTDDMYDQGYCIDFEEHLKEFENAYDNLCDIVEKVVREN